MEKIKKDKPVPKYPVHFVFNTLKDGGQSIHIVMTIRGRRTSKATGLRLLPPGVKGRLKANAETMAKAEAMKRYYITEVILDRGNIDDRSFRADIPLLKFMDSYLAHEKNTVSHWHVAKINLVIAELKNFDPNAILKNIDERWVENFINYEKKRANLAYPGKKLSPYTIKSYIDVLSGAMRHGIRERLIDYDPFANARKGFRLPEKQKCYLSTDEIQKLIDTPTKAQYLKHSFLFAVFTGIRHGDLKKLKWGDIKDVGGQKQIEIMMGKSKTMLYIPLSQMAIKCLPERYPYMTDQHNVFKKMGNSGKSLQRWIKDAGIDKPVSFHTSRHTFVTLLLTAGVDIYTCSKLCGHYSVENTLPYANIINDVKVQAVTLLDDLIETYDNNQIESKQNNNEHET